MVSDRFIKGSSGYTPNYSVGSSGSLRHEGPDVAATRGAGNPTSSREQAFFEIQRKVQGQLASELETLKQDLMRLPPPQARRVVDEHLPRIIDMQAQQFGLVLNRADRDDLHNRCIADILGHGPIEPLLQDDTISEIMINGPYDVWIERYGKPAKTDVRFMNADHLMTVIGRIVGQVGRRVDETSPMVDARLRDGSRVNVVIPPIALDGPVMTIRKFAKRPFQPQDLIDKGSITSDMLKYLEACVKSRLNIIVSGGTSTGKTSFLNVLSVFIQPEQRIITIEDSAELQLQQAHVVRMESRPASVEGRNQVTIRDLVANALRMRPDRIIVGECRGGEALDMLQAMNTGHEGSMTTVHANSAREVIKRLEILALQAGIDLPQRAIREQIVSAVNVIVHLAHMEDGARRVESITEIWPGSNDSAEVVNIFEFQRLGTDPKGKIIGKLRPTGIRPRKLDDLERLGYSLPSTLFEA